jgi:ribose transport system substrate-binding protein
MKRAASRHRRLQRTIVSIATLAVAALGASACSSGSSTPDAASSSNADSSGVAYASAQIAKYTGAAAIPTVQAVSNMPNLKGKTVWYVPLTDSVASFQLAGSSLVKALARLGVKVHTCSGNAEPSTVAQCLNSAATGGAAAVITAYIAYAMVPTAFSNLVAHHIPVVVSGESPSGGASDNAHLNFLPFNAEDYKANALQSDEVIANSHGKADVLAIRLTDSPATIATGNVGLAEYKKHCPGCTVHVLNTQSAQSSNLSSSISAELVKYPNIRYVTAVDDQLSAVTAGIASAGKSDQVKVVSWNGALDGLQNVAASSGSSGVIADIGTTDIFQGWCSADAVVRMLAGDKVPATGVGPIRIFTGSNVSGLTLTTAASNTMQWFGISTDAFQNAFLNAWGAS